MLFFEAQNLPYFMHLLPTFSLYYNNYSTALGVILKGYPQMSEN
jgi:hypothetical protein